MLFERDGAVLAAHRKLSRAPFGGQWLLPMSEVGAAETAEEALRRHAREQFGVDIADETFADTVYLEEPVDQRRYVVNIFRAVLGGQPMRFNADGDYDDARWLRPDELADVWMPPPLREPLIRLLTEPDAGPIGDDWSAPAAAEAVAFSEAVPLAERAEVNAAAEPEPYAPPPDNRAGWDAIAKAYQDERFGDRYAGKLMWSWRLCEDDVRLLDDVHGRRVLVLGCGGGQDVVALERLGAVAVGIDQSAAQIAYARKYAARHDAQNSSFVEGTVEDLSRFDDESFDAAVSAHMLNYVDGIEATLAETHRVLKPGGYLAMSVRHPFDTTLSGAPYRVESSYWDLEHDWTWDFEGGASADLRQWFWPVSRWFGMLTDAGFTVERMLEPREDAPLEEGSGDDIDSARAALIPYTLMFRARKR